jgi:hypothetical protein
VLTPNEVSPVAGGVLRGGWLAGRRLWFKRALQSGFDGRETLDHHHRATTLWTCPQPSGERRRWRADPAFSWNSSGSRAKHGGSNLARRRWARNPNEAPRQYVRKEPPQEFIQGQLHQPLLVLVRRVTPREHHLSALGLVLLLICSGAVKCTRGLWRTKQVRSHRNRRGHGSLGT